MSYFWTPIATAAGLAVVIIGATVAAVRLDDGYRAAHRNDWIAECRDRCIAMHAPEWSYNNRNGCSCGGPTP